MNRVRWVGYFQKFSPREKYFCECDVCVSICIYYLRKVVMSSYPNKRISFAVFVGIG